MRQIKRLSRSVLSAPTLLSLSVSDRQSHPRAHWPAFQGRDVPGDVSGCVQYQSLFPDCVNEILGLCLPDERQSTHTDKYLPIYHHLYQWYCQYHYLTNIGHCQVLSELNNQKTFQFRSLGRSQALHCHPFPHGSMAYHGLPIGLKIDRVVFPHPWFLDVFFGWVVLKKSIEPCRNPWFL